jgi:hypothetical protein
MLGSVLRKARLALVRTRVLVAVLVLVGLGLAVLVLVRNSQTDCDRTPEAGENPKSVLQCD